MVLVKVPECLKKDFRLSRVQNTPRILVLFWRVLVSMCLLISNFFYVPNSFCAMLEKFSRVLSRFWNFIPGLRRRSTFCMTFFISENKPVF